MKPILAMKRTLLSVSLLFFSFSFARSAGEWNVVLIVADDLGYADLGCYGSKDIQSPNIDQLAREGVRFTDFYSNGPECTPTRTALLTGRYQQRAGGLECAIGLDNVGRYDDAMRLADAGQLGLPPAATVLPHVFRERGYATAMIGKWHLGEGPEFLPNRHGFDLFLGITGGAVDYFHHTEPKGVFLGIPIAGDRDFFRNTEPEDRKGEYLTSLISTEAVGWLRKQKADARFFLYLPYTAPHEPIQTPDDWREEPLTTDDWNKGSREAYVRMVEALDAGIGKVLAALEEKGAVEDTVVIFMSDNGPAKYGDAGELRGKKGQAFEGGIKVPCIARWPGRIAAGTVSRQTCITMDVAASLVGMLKASPRPGRALDGMDILGHVGEGRADIPRQLFWRKRRGAATWWAARDGDLKYVQLEDTEKGSNEEYLFDLSSDPNERNDLSGKAPELFSGMKAKLKQWEAEVKPER